MTSRSILVLNARFPNEPVKLNNIVITLQSLSLDVDTIVLINISAYDHRAIVAAMRHFEGKYDSVGKVSIFTRAGKNLLDINIRVGGHHVKSGEREILLSPGGQSGYDNFMKKVGNFEQTNPYNERGRGDEIKVYYSNVKPVMADVVDMGLWSIKSEEKRIARVIDLFGTDVFPVKLFVKNASSNL